jgi:hypothetical protein
MRPRWFWRPFDELLVAGGLGGLAASFRIVSEGLHVGELILECGCELGGGDVVVAVFADVGVGAGAGGEVAAAVAMGDACLEHLAAEPVDLGGQDGPVVDDDR